MILNEDAMNKYMIFIHLIISVKLIKKLCKKRIMYSNGIDVDTSKQLRSYHSLFETSRYIMETSPYKSNPRYAPNIKKKWGKPGICIENEKYSLSLNFIDKTCKIYLFIFV